VFTNDAWRADTLGGVSECFVGGLRLSSPVWFSGGMNATWPFASLVLDGSGLTLALRGPARWLAGGKWFGDSEPVMIPYADLSRVEVLRHRRGIRFHTQSPGERGRRWDRRNGAIFWTFDVGGVLAALASHGVVVE
jgi:hypothetical protein